MADVPSNGMTDVLFFDQNLLYIQANFDFLFWKYPNRVIVLLESAVQHFQIWRLMCVQRKEDND
jgi:hypothetical protein